MSSRTVDLLAQLLRHLTRRERRQLLLLLPTAALVAGLDLGLILSLARLVGRMALGGGVPIQRLVLVVLSLGWCLGMARSLLRMSQYRLAASVAHSLSDQALARLVEQPYGFHLQRDRSEIATRLLHQLPELGPQVVIPCVQAIGNLTTITLLSGGLVVLAGPTSLVVLLLLLLAYALLAQAVKGPLRRWQGEKLALELQAQALVADGLATVRSLLLQGGQPRLVERYGALSRRLARLDGWSAGLPELPRQLVEPVGLSLLLLLLLLPTVRSSGAQSLPWLALVTVAMIRMAQPLQELWRGVNLLQGARPLMGSILQLLALPPLAIAPAAPLGLARTQGAAVALKGVWFRYPQNASAEAPRGEWPTAAGSREDGESWLLRELELELAAGERVGLVGASGAGKSTLASLLLGLLTPQRGGLWVEGQALEGGEITAWQRLCAEVSQPVRLLRGTVAENLIGWGEDPGEARLWEALATAQLASEIRRLPQGLLTPIGEDGLRLSGGQAQRLALARALLLRPRFLVLDEATSALDPGTEAAVLQTLESIASRTTLLVIAHRPATMAACGRLLLLEGGRIREQGDFAELKRSSGAFRRLLAAAADRPRAGSGEEPRPAELEEPRTRRT